MSFFRSIITDAQRPKPSSLINEFSTVDTINEQSVGLARPLIAISTPIQLGGEDISPSKFEIHQNIPLSPVTPDLASFSAMDNMDNEIIENDGTVKTSFAAKINHETPQFRETGHSCVDEKYLKNDLSSVTPDLASFSDAHNESINIDGTVTSYPITSQEILKLDGAKLLNENHLKNKSSFIALNSTSFPATEIETSDSSDKSLSQPMVNSSLEIPNEKQVKIMGTEETYSLSRSKNELFSPVSAIDDGVVGSFQSVYIKNDQKQPITTTPFHSNKHTSSPNTEETSFSELLSSSPQSYTTDKTVKQHTKVANSHLSAFSSTTTNQHNAQTDSTMESLPNKKLLSKTEQQQFENNKTKQPSLNVESLVQNARIPRESPMSGQKAHTRRETTTPTVRIGQIDIIVEAPRQIAQSVAPSPRQGDILSRHYLRGL